LFGIAFIGLAAAYRASGGAVSFQRIAALRRCFFSTFVAAVCTGNPVRVDDVTESPKLAE
jgi:hypothetical protein